MNKTIVVAEKPSVARDIARVLGASGKGNGLLHGNGYAVTWALGHLVHLAEPDDYGPPWKGRWSLEPLPMVPGPWKLRTSKSTRNQYNIVKNLLNDPDTTAIICATDAGREGEHIFRLIHQHAGCKKPFRRLWVSSLTDRAIRHGLQNLQPGSAFDDLARAARARAQADWLVGLNLTRAYTVHNKVLCTIGRVQTPTLAMIVQREEKIASFKKAYFYELVAHLKEGFRAKYSEDGRTRIDAKERAEELHRRLSPHKEGTVTRVDKKIKKHRPPPLYDLNTLQREANQRFGFTASRTLEYAQSLYETDKLITYPRTESRHISPDMVPKLPAVLERLDHPQAQEALERLRQGHKLGKAHVDQNKLTDHHAILPTGQAPSSLSPPLKKVYDLVVARFVAIFLPENVVEETLVELDIGGSCFVAKGALTLELGWKIATQPPAPHDQEEPQQLPPLTKGQKVRVDAMEVVEKETQPPKRYTDATLLSAMKNAGRDIEDEALAEAMKESGLGTPATRAETIEKLIRSDLILRAKKALAPTAKGKALIGVVAGPLKSPELTGEWEQKLKDIEDGRLGAEPFCQSIVDFVRTLIAQVPQSPALPSEVRAASSPSRPGRNGRRGGASNTLGPCPACNKGQIVETPKAYGCSRYQEGCPFTIWKTVAGKKLTLNQVQDLIAKGYTATLRGFKSKAGKKFAARLKMDQHFKVVMDFDNQTSAPKNHGPQDSTPALTCPKCGQGQIIEGRKGFGCNRYREGCDFVVWKEIAGKKLTLNQIERLVTKGKSTLLKGFKNKAGRPFQAYLKLEDNGRIGFEFPAAD